MVTEIELKAHVRDSEALRLLLSEKAEYLGSFEKDDMYWIPDAIKLNNTDSKALTLPTSGLRVRKEKRVLPGGNVEFSVIASYKTKELRDGIEVNDEREFEVRPVSGTQQGPVEFEEFLGRVGLKTGFAKKKRGWAFSHDGITAELVDVEGLGYFVELEILTDDRREENIAGARKRLLDFLDSLGIERAAIESRFYSEMLAKHT